MLASCASLVGYACLVGLVGYASVAWHNLVGYASLAGSTLSVRFLVGTLCGAFAV